MAGDAASHSNEHEPLETLPSAPEPSRARLLGLVTLIVAGFTVAFFLGLLPRVRRSRALETQTLRATRRTLVQVIRPKRESGEGPLTLPGTAQPQKEITIYARVDGYLHNWLVDIGDHVRTGQLLAVIDTPELDEQLREARATLGEDSAAVKQAQTQLELARIEYKRVQSLAGSGLVAIQDRDEKLATMNVAEAAVEAARAKLASQQAEIARLTQLKGFARVTAPFPGVITVRNTEVGALVQSGSGTGAQALFHLAKSSTLRVFVSVPQNEAAEIHVGQKTSVLVHNQPRHPFTGIVTRTARALDEVTHTLLTEVDVDNRDGALLPGTYVEVGFDEVKGATQITIPSNVVLYNAQGTQVAIVDQSERIHLQPVQLGEDYGMKVAILAGLNGDERVVLNPSDKAVEGLEVAVAETEKGVSKTVRN